MHIFVAFDRKDSFGIFLQRKERYKGGETERWRRSVLMFRMEGPIVGDRQPGRTRRWKTFSIRDGQTAPPGQWADKLLSAMAQAGCLH